jgi:signal transduction histidine kinase
MWQSVTSFFDFRPFIQEVRGFLRAFPSDASDGYSQSELAEFRAFYQRLCVRVAQCVAILLGAVVLLCWPTDFVAFAGQPDLFWAFTTFRASLIPTLLVGLLIAEYVVRRRLGLYWLVVILLMVGSIFVPYMVFGELLADLSQPYFYAIFAIPPILIVLPMPLVARSIGTFSIPVLWLSLQALLYPEQLSDPGYAPSVIFAGFMAICSIVVGHGFFLLVRANFFRERELSVERRRVAKANDRLGKFFGNISHEMRTPLSVIRGNLDLLSNRVADDQKAVRWVEGLRRNSARMSLMVEQFLTLSRGADKLDAESQQSIDIADRVRSIVDAVYVGVPDDARPQVRRERPDTFVLTRDLHLSDMLYNLVANAKKFSAQGSGPARVSITIGASRHGSVPISVTDNGPGIPDEKQQQIFERFQQVHDEQRDRLGGVGLGLAIVNELARANEGRVEVHSEPGVETTFTLWLPEADKPPSKSHARESLDRLRLIRASNEDEKDHAKEQESGRIEVHDAEGLEDGLANVFVIDDEPDMLEYLTDILSGEPVEVHAYSSASEALHALEQHEPKLIVSDLMMPRVDGAGVIERLRRTPGFERTPVMIVSADHDTESLVELLDYGAVDFLTKPFVAEEFLARVRRHLEVAEWIRELDATVESMEQVHERLEQNLANAAAGDDANSMGLVDHADLRAQVAQELHDDLGQLIGVCRVELTMAEASSTMPEALDAIQRLRGAIATLSEAFRDSLRSLMSGRARAVTVSEIRRTAELLEGHLDVDINNETFAFLEGLEGEPRQVLLRFAQEAVTNVMKHAGAERAVVRGSRHGNTVRMEVSDDGDGITERRLRELRGGGDDKQVQPTDAYATGVSGLARRVNAIGGLLELESTVGEGTVVSVAIPLAAARTT